MEIAEEILYRTVYGHVHKKKGELVVLPFRCMQCGELTDNICNYYRSCVKCCTFSSRPFTTTTTSTSGSVFNSSRYFNWNRW